MLPIQQQHHHGGLHDLLLFLFLFLPISVRTILKNYQTDLRQIFGIGKV